MERATKRSSCVRQAMLAVPQISPMGTNRNSAMFMKRGEANRSPSAPVKPPVESA